MEPSLTSNRMEVQVNFTKKSAIIIALVLLILLVTPGAGAVGVAGGIEANPLMCVGLTCDSNGKNLALIAANLQNYENAGVAYGLGYRFGYMNAGVFVEVGRTSEKKITMVKNRNVSIDSTGTYIDGTDGAKLIGAYHDDTGLSFDNAQAAADKVAELRATGA